jgi:hypothetical protein
MRTYGRVADIYGNKIWAEVQTDSAGNNEYVYCTAITQVFKLNLGESPFYANFGIPAKQSLITQVHPDYYTYFTQSYFSRFFASLIITKQAQPPNDPTPIYNVSIITFSGTKLQFTGKYEQGVPT